MAPNPPSSETMTRVSTEGVLPLSIFLRVHTDRPSASLAFVSDYYHALQTRRHAISTFYIPVPSGPGTKPTPTIVINGKAFQDGSAVQELFEKQLPPTRYESQCVDCHVLNSNYIQEGQQNTRSPASTITLLVIVSGIVRFGEDRNNPERQFSETLVLIPNIHLNPRHARAKEFLIQSQNFRIVV